MSDFETNPCGTDKLIDRYQDALDHIKRICHMSDQMSKRTYWIAQRAQSALDGDEKWREFDYPRNRSNEKENLRKKNKRLVALLSAAECPAADCDEGIVHRNGEWFECRWCAEKAELIPQEEKTDEQA